ncbi:MAG: phosphoribosylglycinamide formyltransferase [Candidatus Altiarchaeota archaeon]|nr:phosphoribosylglycinamide formyltransferase [Candidatus Altiarchaeota archaeon]
MKRTNLAVFISGRGSNLKAIIDAIERGYLDRVDLKVVVSNKGGAMGIEHAKNAGIPYHIIERGDMTKEEHDEKVMQAIEEYGINLICLAGYMQVLQTKFVRRYRWGMMNIHPSLLPAFGGGIHAQRDALEYGAKISGCTVHFIDEGIDTGPIIIQAAVPVKDSDTEETLAARILEHEHIIYPKAIKLFSEGRLKIEGRKVKVEGEVKAGAIEDARYHMKRIGVSKEAVDGLSKKAGGYSILVENVMPREAMVLKQEMLSRGGDCAVPKDCILNNLVFTDVILLGSSKQFKDLAVSLKKQAFDLPKAGAAIERVIR